MNKPRILLLSAYDAMSHQLWRQRLCSLFPEYHWTELCLPPRHFSWRIRGNSLIWATTEKALLEQPYDLLIATSMVDLSSLRGFIPKLAQIPTLVYVHENQFEYPDNRSNRTNVEQLLVPLYSALCADTLAFNSAYNRNSFLKGARSLLEKLPEQFPDSIIDTLTQSIVLPVPLPNQAQPKITDPVPSKAPLSVVWNHRWEYDKGPGLLLECIRQIAVRSLAVQLHIVGQQFRQQPAEFEEINTILNQHAKDCQLDRGRFGFLPDKSDYAALLASCDVVLSTAIHDFQGLAIQEACLHGCLPLTPDALAYPEYVSAENRFPVLASNKATAKLAVDKLENYLKEKMITGLQSGVDLTQYQGEVIKQRYKVEFDELLDR